MRFIALDVHRDFCEVAVAEGGEVRLAGRVQDGAGRARVVRAELGCDDEVVLEATGNALAIARIIEPHVARVVLAHPKAVKGMTQAGPKTDKIDARALAKLLAGGLVPEVWTVDESTRVLRRRVARRAQLVKQRTREKNQVHAILIRNLRPRPPMSDLFGVAGQGLVGGAGAAWRRARDARGVPARDRLPRRGGRSSRPRAGRACTRALRRCGG